MYVIKGLGAGGAERWLLLATRWLVHRGVQVTIANLNPALDDMQSQLEAAGARVDNYRVFSWLGLTGFHRLLGNVNRSRFDLIHAHLPLAGLAARWVGLIAGIPTVYTEHSMVTRYGEVTRRLHRFTYSLGGTTVAVSRAVRDSISTAYGSLGRRQHIEVIHNPVDLDEVTRAIAESHQVRETLHIPSDQVLIGTVGSFRRMKRLDLLLRAFSVVHARTPNTRLMLVGDGPERRSLEQLTQQLGLTDAVLFTGLQTQPIRYTAALDVFVISSDWEGMPLALLEAMASARAVVATHVGGIPDILSDAHTGILVQPGSVDSLVSGIESFLHRPDVARALGERAREAVFAKHDLDSVMTRYLAIYRDHALAPTRVSAETR